MEELEDCHRNSAWVGIKQLRILRNQLKLFKSYATLKRWWVFPNLLSFSVKSLWSPSHNLFSPPLLYFKMCVVSKLLLFFFFLLNNQDAHGRTPSFLLSIFHLHLLISISEPIYLTMDFPNGSADRVRLQFRRRRKYRFNPFVGKIPWRRKWQLTPIFLPGESHGQRSLADYSPWGCKELDTTEYAHISHWTYLPPSLWNLFLTSLKILPLNHHFQHSPLKTAPSV